jgi:hypothetical protein
MDDAVLILNSPNNTIGGADGLSAGSCTGDCNVFSGAGRGASGSTAKGVRITGAASTGNVRGNFIGVNAGGTTDEGNTTDGVVVDGAASNTIGGTAAGAGNLIGGKALSMSGPRCVIAAIQLAPWLGRA